MYSGQYYIANSEYMTPDAMWSYVEKVKAEMDTAIGKSGSVTTTTEFLTVADNWTTPTFPMDRVWKSCCRSSTSVKNG